MSELRRAETLSMAVAFLEDIAYLRELVVKVDLTPAEIRRASVLVRRLLSDGGGDINRIAPPRNVKVLFKCQNYNGIYRENNRQSFGLLSLGEFSVLGLSIGCIIAESSPRHKNIEIFEFDEIELKCQSFLKQRILCFQGSWISRLDIIKYVSHIAHGVHSGPPKDGIDKLIHRIRFGVEIYKTYISEYESDGTRINLNTDLFNNEIDILVQKKGSFDFIFCHLLSIIKYVVNSPAVIELERVVEAEMQGG